MNFGKKKKNKVMIDPVRSSAKKPEKKSSSIQIFKCSSAKNCNKVLSSLFTKLQMLITIDIHSFHIVTANTIIG